MDNKILIPLQSLVSCFLEPSVNRWVAVGAIEELWQGLLPSVFWRFHCLLRLSSCWVYLRVLKRVRVLCPQSSLCQGSGQWKLSTGQVFSRFSSRLRTGFLGMFLLLLFPPVLQLSLPGLTPGENPSCPASGPNEAQALMSHGKNSVRDKATSKRWIC